MSNRRAEVKVRKKYQITLPTVIREAAGVYEGDVLTAEVGEDQAILLRPSRPVDAEAASDDEAFFYTAEWQAAEQEADEDIQLGRVYRFDNVEEAIEFLHNHDAEGIEHNDAN